LPFAGYAIEESKVRNLSFGNYRARHSRIALEYSQTPVRELQGRAYG
jgi:hypothetical protein